MTTPHLSRERGGIGGRSHRLVLRGRLTPAQEVIARECGLEWDDAPEYYWWAPARGGGFARAARALDLILGSSSAGTCADTGAACMPGSRPAQCAGCELEGRTGPCVLE